METPEKTPLLLKQIQNGGGRRPSCQLRCGVICFFSVDRNTLQVSDLLINVLRRIGRRLPLKDVCSRLAHALLGPSRAGRPARHMSFEK